MPDTPYPSLLGTELFGSMKSSYYFKTDPILFNKVLVLGAIKQAVFWMAAGASTTQALYTATPTRTFNISGHPKIRYIRPNFSHIKLREIIVYMKFLSSSRFVYLRL